MKKWMGICLSALLLAACSDDAEPAGTEQKTAEQTEQEVPEAKQQEMNEEGFITQVKADGILVNNIFFAVSEDAEVVWDNETEEKAGELSEIEAGMKVAVDYQGPPTGQFPMEASADAITILNHEEEAKQAAALKAFIKEEQLSDLMVIGQPLVRDNEIGFLFNNTETGKMEEIRINLDTHEYTVGGDEREAEEAAQETE